VTRRTLQRELKEMVEKGDISRHAFATRPVWVGFAFVYWKGLTLGFAVVVLALYRRANLPDWRSPGVAEARRILER